VDFEEWLVRIDPHRHDEAGHLIFRVARSSDVAFKQARKKRVE